MRGGGSKAAFDVMPWARTLPLTAASRPDASIPSGDKNGLRKNAMETSF